MHLPAITTPDQQIFPNMTTLFKISIWNCPAKQ